MNNFIIPNLVTYYFIVLRHPLQDYDWFLNLNEWEVVVLQIIFVGGEAVEIVENTKVKIAQQ